MKAIFRLAPFAFVFAATLSASFAQRTGQPDKQIDAATRSAVVERLSRDLVDMYIFPATAEKMKGRLQERLTGGAYERLTSGKEFATALTAELHEISRDKHLRVRYSPKPLPPDFGEWTPPTPREEEQFRRQLARDNFNVRKAEHLPGNVGYFELDAFAPSNYSADAVAAAFDFIGNTDALIIDLRRNSGGAPNGVALVCSYLFGEKPVHLNDLIKRERTTEVREEFWTLRQVKGRRYLNKLVYVLTSARTFSGGEEFANNLKVLKRAILVGETTGGGANPGSETRLADHFSVFIPDGRAENPVTKTNWEGTGVEPDVKVPADQALIAAHRLALEKLLHAGKDDPTRKADLQSICPRLNCRGVRQLADRMF